MSESGSPIDIEQILEPEAFAAFERLCMPTSSTELADLAGVVRLHRQHIAEVATNQTDLEMADRIAAVFEQLLASSDGYTDEERTLIRGAAEYFLLADDADGDIDDPLGFDDDARVLNSVLHRIEKEGLTIDFV